MGLKQAQQLVPVVELVDVQVADVAVEVAAARRHVVDHAALLGGQVLDQRVGLGNHRVTEEGGS